MKIFAIAITFLGLTIGTSALSNIVGHPADISSYKGTIKFSLKSELSENAQNVSSGASCLEPNSFRTSKEDNETANSILFYAKAMKKKVSVQVEDCLGKSAYTPKITLID